MKSSFNRRSALKAGAALAAVSAVPAWAQAKPTLRFAAVFSDKDIRAEMIKMLAADVGAGTLVMLTGVERVALDFGKPSQRVLDRMTVVEARKHLAEGQFPVGSIHDNNAGNPSVISSLIVRLVALNLATLGIT